MSDMYTGIYTGIRKRLFNKSSLLLQDPDCENQWLAQFDALNLEESHHWHVFKKSDFVNVRRLDADG